MAAFRDNKQVLFGIFQYVFTTTVAIGKPEPHVRKALYCGSKQRWRSCAATTLLLLVRATCISVLFIAHIPFVVNHTFNTTPTERLQQHSILFTTNRTDRTFFLRRFHTARPSHPGHSTILLRTEIPSGMCAKLRIVAASNNRDHAPQSLYYCLFAPHICGVVLRAYPIGGESHIQSNANGEIATLPIHRKTASCIITEEKYDRFVTQ